MSSLQVRRLYCRLRNNRQNPYRRGQPPALLLRASLEASHHDTSTLHAALEDFIEHTLSGIYADPTGYTENCRQLISPPESIDHDEQALRPHDLRLGLRRLPRLA